MLLMETWAGPGWCRGIGLMKICPLWGRVEIFGSILKFRELVTEALDNHVFGTRGDRRGGQQVEIDHWRGRGLTIARWAMGHNF